MKITIDQQVINVKNSELNIVEIAKENGIIMCAPCYQDEQIRGMCGACLIYVDGKEAYACATKPVDGMQIIYNNPTLEQKRSKRMAEYESSSNQSGVTDRVTVETGIGGLCIGTGCCMQNGLIWR